MNRPNIAIKLAAQAGLAVDEDSIRFSIGFCQSDFCDIDRAEVDLTHPIVKQYLYQTTFESECAPWVKFCDMKEFWDVYFKLLPQEPWDFTPSEYGGDPDYSQQLIDMVEESVRIEEAGLGGRVQTIKVKDGSEAEYAVTLASMVGITLGYAKHAQSEEPDEVDLLRVYATSIKILLEAAHYALECALAEYMKDVAKDIYRVLSDFELNKPSPELKVIKTVGNYSVELELDPDDHQMDMEDDAGYTAAEFLKMVESGHSESLLSLGIRDDETNELCSMSFFYYGPDDEREIKKFVLENLKEVIHEVRYSR